MTDRKWSNPAIRITVLALLVSLSSTGCVPSPQPEPLTQKSSTPVLRVDLEPLTRRFPRLGQAIEAHWQGRVIGADSRLPGPSDTLIEALVVLHPDDFATISDRYTWQPADKDWDDQMSEQLRPHTPPNGDWQYSEDFERDVRTPVYHGSVHLDLRSRTAYLKLYTT